MTLIEHIARGSAGAIPLPAGDKEVLKVKVYERTMTLNSQLAPVFPTPGRVTWSRAGACCAGVPARSTGSSGMRTHRRKWLTPSGPT